MTSVNYKHSACSNRCTNPSIDAERSLVDGTIWIGTVVIHLSVIVDAMTREASRNDFWLPTLVEFCLVKLDEDSLWCHLNDCSSMAISVGADGHSVTDLYGIVLLLHTLILARFLKKRYKNITLRC